MLFLPAFLLSKNKFITVFINLILIIVFASIYFALGTKENFQFKNDPNQTALTPLTALYFSFVTHCTIGYGDIIPTSNVLLCLVMTQCICMISFLFL